MSLEMQVFVPEINDEYIPMWINRINTLGMKCEIHPSFSFESHTGFLPFKVLLENSSHESILGTEWLTGFDFYMQNFNLQEELKKIHDLQPKISFFEKIKGKKIESVFFASKEIDERLAVCNKVISCVWGSSDTLELRMATLSSAILAEITGGLFCYSADNFWHTETNEVGKALKEAEAYEASVRQKQLKLHKFEKWL